MQFAQRTPTAGNLVFDGDYLYQYDAWARLAQVNRKGLLTGGSFDGDGKLLSTVGPSDIGDLAARYAYDGLGRLILKTVKVNATSSCLQHQHFYYDGARRLQEQWYTETTNCGNPQTVSGEWATKREYLHGPDYIDEHVAQIHNPACDCALGNTCGGGGENGSGGGNCTHCGPDASLVVYTLQDGNYNVVATLADGCPSGNCGNGQSWTPTGPVAVYEQYTYEPYGQPASVDKFVTPAPQNPVGHQGLFYDHYSANTPTDPCILVNHKGLYQNRNRFYHPKLGRFTTPDPNSSAVSLIQEASYHGVSPAALALTNSGSVSSYSPMGQFGDGMSSYGYLKSNPVAVLDALGLYEEDEYDELIADRTGHALYALGTLNEGARIASIGLQTAVGIAAGFLPGSGLYDAFQSVKVIASGKGGFWDAVNIAAAALPTVKVVAAVAGGSLAFKALSKAMAWRSRAARMGGIVGKFGQWLQRGTRDRKVYIGYKDGRAVYVGISNDLVQRAQKHGKRFDKLEKIADNLTENEAKAIEQVIIESNWTRFENRNNSIAFENEFYDEAATWALEKMSDLGLPRLWQ